MALHMIHAQRMVMVTGFWAGVLALQTLFRWHQKLFIGLLIGSGVCFWFLQIWLLQVSHKTETMISVVGLAQLGVREEGNSGDWFSMEEAMAPQISLRLLCEWSLIIHFYWRCYQTGRVTSLNNLTLEDLILTHLYYSKSVIPFHWDFRPV